MAEAKKMVTKKYATGKGELMGYVSILAPSKKYDNYALLKIGENRYYYLNVDDEDYSFYDFMDYIKEIIEGAGIKIDVL